VSAAKLLPCPFCGGEATYITGIDKRFVSCMDCRAATICETLDSSESLWNRRIDARAPVVGMSDGELIARTNMLSIPDWRDFAIAAFGDTKEMVAEGGRFIEENARQIAAELTRRAEARKGGGK
jgi:hypothetical protein